MRPRLLIWGVVYSVLVLALVALGASRVSPTRAQGQFVGLVVAYSPTEVVTACIPYRADMNGLAVLSQYTQTLVLNQQNTSFGAAVCQIGQLGCSLSESCFCQCTATSCNLWAYHHLIDGQWQFETRSASQYTIPGPGAVEGWAWGAGSLSDTTTPASGARPPLLTFEAICAAALTPSPTATADGSPTLSPTSTALPTSTPRRNSSDPFENPAASPTSPLQPVATTAAPTATPLPATATPISEPASSPATATPTMPLAPTLAPQEQLTRQPAQQTGVPQPLPTATPLQIVTDQALLPLPTIATSDADPDQIEPEVVEQPRSWRLPTLTSIPPPVIPELLPLPSPLPSPTRVAGAAPPEEEDRLPLPEILAASPLFDPLPYLAVTLVLVGLGKAAFDAAWRWLEAED